MVFLILKLSHYFKGLLLCLYVVVCIIEWLCNFFLGFYCCIGTNSIDYSFFAVRVIVIVIVIVILILLRCFGAFPSVWCFCPFNGMVLLMILMIVMDSWFYGDIFGIWFVCFHLFFDGSVLLLLLLSLLLLRFIVVLRSFVTSFVFNHGITSYCLPIGLLLLLPPWCCFLYCQLSWALIWFDLI